MTPDSAPLSAALEAAHAVVYGYGVLGARLDDERRRAAVQARDSARSRRDSLAARLRERGAEVPGTLPAYDVAVADAAAALALAVRLEEGMGVRWRDLVAGTDDPALRRLGLAGLQETALRAATWRARAGAGLPPALPGAV